MKPIAAPRSTDAPRTGKIKIIKLHQAYLETGRYTTPKYQKGHSLLQREPQNPQVLVILSNRLDDGCGNGLTNIQGGICVESLISYNKCHHKTDPTYNQHIQHKQNSPDSVKNRGLYQWYSVYDLYGVWLRGGGSAINGKPNTNDPT